jgi:hypothetical protein
MQSIIENIDLTWQQDKDQKMYESIQIIMKLTDEIKHFLSSDDGIVRIHLEYISLLTKVAELHASHMHHIDMIQKWSNSLTEIKLHMETFNHIINNPTLLALDNNCFPAKTDKTIGELVEELSLRNVMVPNTKGTQDTYYIMILMLLGWRKYSISDAKDTNPRACKLDRFGYPTKQTHVLVLCPDHILRQHKNVSPFLNHVINIIDKRDGHSPTVKHISDWLLRLDGHFFRFSNLYKQLNIESVLHATSCINFLHLHDVINCTNLEILNLDGKEVHTLLKDFVSLGYDKKCILKSKIKCSNGYIFTLSQSSTASCAELLGL